MKILKLPMRNYSTLVYLVNSFQSELNQFNLVETSINRNLETMSKKNDGPSDRIIENILNFARSYEVCKTEKAGYVELNLN
ncbi:hypothetical protein MASR2M47_04050 [Draconibacterium sp.]